MNHLESVGFMCTLARPMSWGKHRSAMLARSMPFPGRLRHNG